MLPHLGELLGIFAEIKSPASDVQTSADRELALIARLQAWVSEVRRMGSVPKAESFVCMLCSTVAKKTNTRMSACLGRKFSGPFL